MGFGTSSPDGPETPVSHYTATVVWERNGAAFSDKRYSRAHRWIFDGGIELSASPSPHVVRPPMAVEEAVEREEAFVASLASCHMLSFLYVAGKRGYVVESYRDEATGTLAKNADSKMAMTEVTLHPAVAFAGERPATTEHEAMHHEAQ